MELLACENGFDKISSYKILKGLACGFNFDLKEVTEVSDCKLKD